MSNITYERLWREAEEGVRQVLEDDKAYVGEDVIEDRPRAFKQAATNYIHYTICVNKLSLCVDQMIHVQKRKTVKNLLETTIARLLQVKQELVNMDTSDFSYLDGILMEMKLSPYDVELQIPRYYRGERTNKINEDIDRILYELANPPTPAEVTEEHEEGDAEAQEEKPGKMRKAKEKSVVEEEKEKESPSKKKKESINPNWPPRFKKVEITESQKMFKQIIQMVQNHERARKARLATKELLEKQRIQYEIAWLIYKPIPDDVKDWAVNLIQRFWRGYAKRHREWYTHTQGRLLIGEVTPSWRSHAAFDKARQVEEERRAKQKDADEEYTKDMEDLKEQIDRRDEDKKEDIADHLRWYIEDWYRKVGELPAFPEPTPILPHDLLGFPKETPAEWLKRMVKVVPTGNEFYPGLPPHLAGGSALVVAGYWVDPELYDLAHTVAMLAKGQPGNKPQKKEKLTKQQIKEKKEEEKETQRLEKEKALKDLEEKLKKGVVPNQTTLLEPLSRLLDKDKAQWGDHEDLEWNPGQKNRRDLPTGEMVYEQHQVLREVVDDLMRLELERLQAALNRDRGKKAKGQEKKKKKKGKPKAKKDMTKDRTTESLFKELVEKEIIKKTPDGKADYLFCQPSWNNYDLKRHPFWENPPPNLWDVKQAVKEYCILPLGSATVHREAPLVRSVLLAGYPDCGKRLLADAVVAETGAVLFDLTPSNTANKYPGKKGLKMLVHLVSKMSVLLQPSVVFMEGGEKPFYKKVPKPEREHQPKLLKSQLPKMVKAVTPEDQVLFLATADNPWMGAAKSIAKTYNKIIMVLPPDQSTASSYWHHQLMKYHGVHRDFLYSPLSWCTQGLTLPTIDKVIRNVLTAERIIALKYRPLDPQELLDQILKETPITEDQVRKLVDWHASTYPLAKKKAEKAKEDKELRDKIAAMEAKKKEQQKKKKDTMTMLDYSNL